MKTSFLKILSIFMILATLLSIISIFIFQTDASKTNMKNEAIEKFEAVKKSIANNEREIQVLKQTLNTDYLAKTHAFADMIALNPAIINDKDELERIRKDIDVEELHVIDKDGIIRWGTVDDYIGFDCTSSEQTKPFMEGITNTNFELAQEPQLNGTKNILFQYIGVSRKDKPGVVQIGMAPTRLETALENNTLQHILSQYTIGNSGYIFSLDKTNNTITSFPDETIIGKSALDIGLPSSLSQNGFAKINGVNSYYITTDYNNYLLCVSIPKSELYSTRNNQLVITLLSNIIIFVILTCLIAKLLQNSIVNGINKIVVSLEEIQNGNLDTRVDVHNHREFQTLSNGINNMVQSLKKKIQQTQQLIQESKQLLDKKNQTSIDVKNCSKDITSFSEELLTISKTLAQGSTEQESAITLLSQNINQVSEQMQNNSILANKAKSIAQNAGNELLIGNEKVFEMATAMQIIYDSSSEISKIIKTIDEIAEQSNLLALNASVEAARAGEHGKEFAIIANEVKDLASKSMDAADNTNELIQNTINAINKGSKQAQDTIKTLETVTAGAKEATELMTNVAKAAEDQKTAFTDISSGINQIASVVETNTTAAQISENTSKQLADKSIQLRKIISE